MEGIKGSSFLFLRQLELLFCRWRRTLHHELKVRSKLLNLLITTQSLQVRSIWGKYQYKWIQVVLCVWLPVGAENPSDKLVEERVKLIQSILQFALKHKTLQFRNGRQLVQYGSLWLRSLRGKKKLVNCSCKNIQQRIGLIWEGGGEREGARMEGNFKRTISEGFSGLNSTVTSLPSTIFSDRTDEGKGVKWRPAVAATVKEMSKSTASGKCNMSDSTLIPRPNSTNL